MHAPCFTPIVLDSPVDYAGVQASLSVLGLLQHLTTSTLCEQSVVSSLFHTAQADEPAQFCKRGKATQARLTFSLISSRLKWSQVNCAYGVRLLSISCNEMPSGYYVEQMKVDDCCSS